MSNRSNISAIFIGVLATCALAYMLYSLSSYCIEKFTPVTYSVTMDVDEETEAVIHYQNLPVRPGYRSEKTTIKPGEVVYCYYPSLLESRKEEGLSFKLDKQLTRLSISGLECNSWLSDSYYSAADLSDITSASGEFFDHDLDVSFADSKLFVLPGGDRFHIGFNQTIFSPVRRAASLFALGLTLVLSLLFFIFIKPVALATKMGITNENGVFLAVTASFLLFFSFGPRTYISSENRLPHSYPDLKSTFIWDIPDKVDLAFADQFPFKEKITVPLSYIKLFLFNESPLPSKVEVGKDGWLYMMSDIDRIMETRSLLFTEEELESILITLEERRIYTKKMGGQYYFMPCVSKTSIYPEYLDGRLNLLREDEKHDQLIDYIKSNSTIRILEIKDALNEAKKDSVIYYHTDSHWNRYGAFVAYTSVMKQLRAWEDDSLFILNRDHVNITRHTESGGDLADLIKLTDYITDEAYDVSIKSPKAVKVDAYNFPELTFLNASRQTMHPDTSRPSLVMLRDSFSNNLHPLFSESFHRAAFYWTYHYFPEVVERERPDILIDQHITRFIDILLVNPPRLKAAVADEMAKLNR